MGGDPFARYDEVVAESQPLEKEIKGEAFVFPGACPADIAMEFVNIAAVKELDTSNISLMLLPKVIPEQIEKLFGLVSLPEATAIAVGLFTHYGLLSDEPEASPNPEARRSPSPSSKGSARSDLTSAATTN